MGMRPIVIDSGEAKRKLALELGAEAFIDFREHKDVAAEIVKIADGIGAHGVIVTAYQAYPDAISYIGKRISAKIVCVAFRKWLLRISALLLPHTYHSSEGYGQDCSRSRTDHDYQLAYYGITGWNYGGYRSDAAICKERPFEADCRGETAFCSSRECAAGTKR